MIWEKNNNFIVIFKHTTHVLSEYLRIILGLHNWPTPPENLVDLRQSRVQTVVVEIRAHFEGQIRHSGPSYFLIL